jgi:TonB family protein
MNGLVERSTGSGYCADVPRRRAATIVLLLHILLLVLMSRAAPEVPLPAEPRPIPIDVTLPPLDPPVVPPPRVTLPAERAAPGDRVARVEAPARRPGPAGPAPGPIAPEPPAPPQPAAGSPAPMSTPLPVPASTPARGESAVAGTGGSSAGSGTGHAGAGGGGGGAGGGGGGGGRRARARPPETIAAARWVEMMGWEELQSYLPWSARQAGMEGYVTLICRVRLDRTVHGCRIERELPDSYGFGRAALRASRRFLVYPRRVDGVEIADGLVRIPIRFNLR